MLVVLLVVVKRQHYLALALFFKYVPAPVKI